MGEKMTKREKKQKKKKKQGCHKIREMDKIDRQIDRQTDSKKKLEEWLPKCRQWPAPTS
jgi:hypothetical protein